MDAANEMEKNRLFEADDKTEDQNRRKLKIKRQKKRQKEKKRNRRIGENEEKKN